MNIGRVKRVEMMEMAGCLQKDKLGLVARKTRLNKVRNNTNYIYLKIGMVVADVCINHGSYGNYNIICWVTLLNVLWIHPSLLYEIL